MIEHARWTLGKSLKDFRTGIADETEVLSAIEVLIEAKKYLPQRQWVGLTNEEVESIWDYYCDEMGFVSIGDARDIAQAIEAKLKEKNT